MSDQESSAICSARGCKAAATWAVVWNNPRLHTPDREKIWVACGEHKQPLADYLAVACTDAESERRYTSVEAYSRQRVEQQSDGGRNGRGEALEGASVVCV
jgi:hypothetical protein